MRKLIVHNLITLDGYYEGKERKLRLLTLGLSCHLKVANSRTPAPSEVEGI